MSWSSSHHWRRETRAERLDRGVRQLRALRQALAEEQTANGRESTRMDQGAKASRPLKDAPRVRTSED